MLDLSSLGIKLIITITGLHVFYKGLAGLEILAGALFLELIVDYTGEFKAVASSHLYPFHVIGQQVLLFNLRESSTK